MGVCDRHIVNLSQINSERCVCVRARAYTVTPFVVALKCELLSCKRNISFKCYKMMS